MTRGSRPRPVLIGLTGPIGCGKSTIAARLGAAGARVIDADRLAREVTEPGEPALAAIAERFGPEVLGPDGELDRAALARRVFSDPAELRALEAITHPAIRPRLLEAIEAARAAAPAAVVVEAIRLVEGGYADLFDEVWLVVCGSDAQRARLARRGVEPAEIERRIVAQAGLLERVRPVATRTIDTSGSLAGVLGDVDAALADALAATRGF